MLDRFILIQFYLNYCTRKNLPPSQRVVFATSLQQACRQVVTMLLFYQVATRLSLTTFSIVGR